MNAHVLRRRSLVVLAAVATGVLLMLARGASAVTSADATDIAPSVIKASSDEVGIFGVDLRTSALAGDELSAVEVRFTNAGGFEPSDLTLSDGVQVWRDSSVAGGAQDALDAGDTLVSSGVSWSSTTATVSISDGILPTSQEGLYTFIVTIKTRGSISNGDKFTATLPGDAFTLAPGVVLMEEAVSKTITADTEAPATPSVSAVGLSKAAGKVSVGDQPISDESTANLQVWQTTNSACLSPSLVTETGVQDLRVTNADLAGSTESQMSALKAIDASKTVCYRLVDAAGNLSDFVADGGIPSAPAQLDVNAVGVSNVDGLRRVYAVATSQSAKTLRMYIRPGGSGLVRAQSAAGSPVDISIGSTAANSGTTHIVQHGTATALAAGDGISYSRVNSAGNESSATADGTIPAAPSGDDAGLLRTSAVAGSQRVIASADASPGRTFGLYIDPADSGWARALRSAGGTTPVRVTTGSAATDSGTESIFVGSDAFEGGASLGFVTVDANGNESDAASDGSIPVAPGASALAFSDALDSFTVDPFPAGQSVRMFVGEDMADAYSTIHAGEATSASPASVNDLAAGDGLFYTAVDASGNESPMTADGVVPAAPASSDLGLLSVSAADGHQRLNAVGHDDAARVFRLYADPAGGTAWERATGTSEGTDLIEVTTSQVSAESSESSSIFVGASQLDAGDAIGYALVNSNGNESDVSAEGAIPSAPSAAAASVSNALDEFVSSEASASNQVNLFLGSSTDTVQTAYGAPDAVASTTSPVSLGASPAEDDTVFVTAIASGSGHESRTTADGTIPASDPDDADRLGASAAAGHQRIIVDADESASRTFRLYLQESTTDPWVRASTSGDSASPVEVTSGSGSVSSATNAIFAGSSPLASGHQVAYALVNPAGHDSALIQDGSIPASADVSQTSATAARDLVSASALPDGIVYHVYSSTSSEPATAYDGTPNVTLLSAGSEGLDTTAGDRLFYAALDTASGNEAALSADGQIPASLDADATSASDALDSFTIPGASETSNVRIFLSTSSNPLTAYGQTHDYEASSSPFAAPADLPAEFVHFTVRNSVSGNESAITSDGFIPGIPAGIGTAMTTSAASQTITANPDSTVRTVRLYLDPDGESAYQRATTSASGSTPVELTTSRSAGVSSASGIFAGSDPIDEGASVGYARVVNGNDSDVVADGSIPAAPTEHAEFAASAAAQKATIGSTVPSGIVRMYNAMTPVSDWVMHETGTGSAITPIATLVSGDQIGYALTDPASLNESPAMPDGSIPAAPSAASISASARTDQITATGATATTNVLAFVHGTSDQAAAYAAGSDLQITSNAPAGIDVSAGDHLFFTSMNDRGNESTLVADGSIPAQPSLPSAGTLVAAGDGGSGAPSATINENGRSAVTLRPGHALAQIGDSIRLAMSRGDDEVVGWATALSADVTPVFGASTEQVAYGAPNQDGASGALDVSSLSDGSVSVVASARNAAGNESPASAPASLLLDTVAEVPGAPDLDAASDTGRLDTDNITKDTTPSFSVSGEDGATVRLFEDGTELGSSIVEDGTAVITSQTLAGGVHSIAAKATDPAGNVSGASDALQVRILAAGPAMPTGVLVPASPSNIAIPAVAGAVDDDTVSVEVIFAREGQQIRSFSLEAAMGAYALGEAAYQSTALSDGTYSVTAVATDSAGNVSQTAMLAEAYVVDTVAPDAPGAPDLADVGDSGSSSTDDLTNVTTPTLSVRAEPGSSVELFESDTSLGSDVADETGVAEIMLGEALEDGEHVLAATATDPAGNLSAPSETLTITVDTEPSVPGAPDLDAASDSGHSAIDNITSVTTPMFSISSEDGAIVRLFEDGTELGSGIVEDGTAQITSSELDTGMHTIVAQATDLAGNTSEDSEALGVRILGVGPALPTGVLDPIGPSNDATPAIGGIVDENTVSVTVTFAREGADDRVISIEAVDDAYAIGEASYDGTPLADGTYSVTAVATDSAGNVSQTAMLAEAYVVDTVAPDAPGAPDLADVGDSGSSSTDDLTNVTTPTLSVQAEPASSVELFESDTSLGSDVADETGVAEIVLGEALEDGEHVLAATATDPAGNPSALSETLTIMVDTGLPVAPTIDQPVSGLVGSAVAASGTAEPGSSVAIFDAAASIANAVADQSGAWSSNLSLAIGAHSLTATATDAAGNVSPASNPSVDVTVEPVAAPSAPDLIAGSDLGSSSTDDVTNDATPSLGFTAEPGVTLSVFDGPSLLGSVATDETGVATLTVDTLADGMHSITATATNALGTVSESSPVLGITIDTETPDVPAITRPMAGRSVTRNVTIAGTSEPFATIGLIDGVTSAGSAVADSEGNWSKSLTMTNGAHALTVVATDLAGNGPSAASAPHAINVDGAIPTAIVTVPSTLTGNVLVVFSKPVSGVDGSNVVLRANGATVPASVRYTSSSRTARLDPNDTLIPGRTYTVVVAPSGSDAPVDASGNAVAETVKQFRASMVEEESSIASTYDWDVVSNASAVGGRYANEAMAGARASYSFSGSSVSWYTVRGPKAGVAEVLIDGASKGTFDLYAARPSYGYKRTFKGLTKGPHTLQVVVRGKNARATDSQVAIDAFGVGSNLDANPAVDYAWRSAGSLEASGGRVSQARTAGSRLSFTFAGTAIEWQSIGGSDQGKAKVFIDGELVGEYDNYRSSSQVLRRTFKNLSDGVHTIRIVVTGDKHARSRGTTVTHDRWHVL